MSPTKDSETPSQTVVLLLADIAPAHRLWGWSRLVKGTAALNQTPGLLFSKILGSGYEGGFGLKPSASRQGVFGLFNSAAAAAYFLNRSDEVAAYRERSSELLTITLQTYACRGTWDGQALDVATRTPETGPIAALTRASIRPPKARAFWRYAPASQTALESSAGCQLAVGLGEAPLIRQATFTVWDSVDAMNAYARTGPHLEAIQVAHQKRYFAESMFARFTPIQMNGVWRGKQYA